MSLGTLPPTESGRAGGAGGQGRWPRRASSEDTGGVVPAPLPPAEGRETAPGLGARWGACSPGTAPRGAGESRLMLAEIRAFVMEKNSHPPSWPAGSGCCVQPQAGETGPHRSLAARHAERVWPGRARPGVPGQVCGASHTSQEINRDKQLQALEPGNCRPFTSRAAFLPSRVGHSAACPRARAWGPGACVPGAPWAGSPQSAWCRGADAPGRGWACAACSAWRSVGWGP